MVDWLMIPIALRDDGRAPLGIFVVRLQCVGTVARPRCVCRPERGCSAALGRKGMVTASCFLTMAFSAGSLKQNDVSFYRQAFTCVHMCVLLFCMDMSGHVCM